MKKIFLLPIVLLLSTSIASASSYNGDFEGNPIVTVKSNGNPLTVQDVPAINFKDRTMVPIYLLKELGADVIWNGENYSVDVTLKNKDDSLNNQKLKEYIGLKNTYEWLRDTDTAMWMFVVKLNHYSEIDTDPDLIQKIENEYIELSKLYIESYNYVTEFYKNNQDNVAIYDCISRQVKLISLIEQTKTAHKIWSQDKTNLTISKSFKVNILNALVLAEQNITSTNKIIHSLKSF